MSEIPDLQAVAIALELAGAGAEAKIEGDGPGRAVVLTLRARGDTYAICRAWAEKQKSLPLPGLQIKFKSSEGSP